MTTRTVLLQTNELSKNAILSLEIFFFCFETNEMPFVESNARATFLRMYIYKSVDTILSKNNKQYVLNQFYII